MADSGMMRSLCRHRRGIPSLRLGAVCLAVLFAAGCSVEEPTAAELGLEEGPARLVLEPGDDPTEAAEQLAVPTTEPAVDEPADALASTEGLADTEPTGPVTLPEGLGDEDTDVTGAPSADGGAATEPAVDLSLGILTPDQDLAQIQASFGDAGLTALYDVNTQTVIVRDTPVTPLLRTSLVHELTRALDDQQFGIRRPDGVERVAEVEWARAALVHGSAAEIADRYRATLSAAEVAEETAEVAALPRNVSLSLFTDSFLELQFGRQFYGEVAAADLWEQGQAALDAALTSPPDSSEQLIVGADAGPAASVATPPGDAQLMAVPA